MEATYWDPHEDRAVTTAVETGDDFRRLVEVVAEFDGGRERPAISLASPNGSSVTFASDGVWAFLVWMDSLGASHRTLGGAHDQDLVFDFMGSWSEAPADALVPVSDGMDAPGLRELCPTKAGS